jgi:fumarate hydratase class I
VPVILEHGKKAIEVRLILKGGRKQEYHILFRQNRISGGQTGPSMVSANLCRWQAKSGCSIGAIGVAGGDRASGYHYAKQQLFRTLDDINPNPELAKLEQYVMDKSNTLGIGTMGFGGEATLIGCKIGAYHRLPASFFVSVAYDCWAFRRLGVVLDARTGGITRWLYKEDTPSVKMARGEGLPLTGREIRLTLPLDEVQVRALKVGDVVLLNGPMHTGRDSLHHYLLTHESPVPLQGSAIYHCGPVSLRKAKLFMNAAGRRP